MGKLILITVGLFLSLPHAWAVDGPSILTGDLTSPVGNAYKYYGVGKAEELAISTLESGKCTTAVCIALIGGQDVVVIANQNKYKLEPEAAADMVRLVVAAFYFAEEGDRELVSKGSQWWTFEPTLKPSKEATVILVYQDAKGNMVYVPSELGSPENSGGRILGVPVYPLQPPRARD